MKILADYIRRLWEKITGKTERERVAWHLEQAAKNGLPIGWERFDKKSGQWVGCDYYEAHGYTSRVPLPGCRAVYTIRSATQPTGRKD